MRILAALLGLLVSGAAFAQSSSATGGPPIQNMKMATPQELARYSRKAQVEKGLLVMAGMDLRNQRNEMQETEVAMAPNLGVGYVWSNWIGNFEYGFHDTSTGNSTLSVDRRTETMMIWGYWQATDNRYVTPYLGAGLGTQRETVKTTLLGSEDVDSSGNYWTTGLGFGLRYFPKTRLWMSTEGRVYKNSHQDPDPALGLMVRIGFRI